jgi:hypothetical protein
MTQRISWSRVLAEGAIIVLSILLAFGIDAWWQGRGERAQETATLVGLTQDFAAIEEHLESVGRDHEDRIEAADRILKATGRTPGVYDGVLGDLSITKNLNPIAPNSGTLNSLLQSSGLELLHNDELRRALSDWTQSLEEVKESPAWAWTVVTEWETYLVGRVPLREIDPANSYSSEPPGGSDFEVGLARMLGDLELENHVHRQRQASQSILHQLTRLDGSVSRIRGLLEAELAGR